MDLKRTFNLNVSSLSLRVLRAVVLVMLCFTIISKFLFVLNQLHSNSLSFDIDYSVMNQFQDYKNIVHKPRFVQLKGKKNPVFDLGEILISLETATYFDGNDNEWLGQPSQKCMYDDMLLDCTISKNLPPVVDAYELVEGKEGIDYGRENQTIAKKQYVDAFLYFLPYVNDDMLDSKSLSFIDKKPKRRPEQMNVAWMMENFSRNQEYGKFIAAEDVRSNFDAFMSYRLDSEIPIPYYSMLSYGVAHYNFEYYQTKPVPFRAKRKAFSVVIWNCWTSWNARQDFLGTLINEYSNDIEIHSFGECHYNADKKGVQIPVYEENTGRRAHLEEKDKLRAEDKVGLFSQYVFCSAIENSVGPMYVSEKLYDGLRAGCIPIIYGPVDVAETFLPSNNAVIDLADFLDTKPKLSRDLPPLNGTIGNMVAKRLVKKMNQILLDQKLHDSYLAWKKKPLEQLNPGFQKIVKQIDPEPRHSCRLCQYLATQRLQRTIDRYSHSEDHYEAAVAEEAKKRIRDLPLNFGQTFRPDSEL